MNCSKCRIMLPAERRARYCKDCQRTYDQQRGRYIPGVGRPHEVEYRNQRELYGQKLFANEVPRTPTLKVVERLYKEGLNVYQIEKETGLPLLNVVDSIMTIRPLRKHETLTKNKKVGHWDIETSALNASFGFLISWAIKEDGSDEDDIAFDALNKEDFATAGFEDPDKRIVTSMIKKLNEFDVITFHYGDRFDGPFARTRAMLYNLPFPEYGQVKQVDTWMLTRKLLKLHNNRLDSVAEFLGVNSKTPLHPSTWRRASRGSMSDIAEIVEHNKQDVITLEKVYHRLKFYSGGVRRSL